MKTIKLPVTAAGNVIVEPSGTTIALSFDHATEIAQRLNSHDAFVKVAKAVVKAADANSPADVATILGEVLADAESALKLAEGK